MRNDYDEADVRRLIAHLAEQITAAFPREEPLNVVGIRTRGEVLAARLTDLLTGAGRSRSGRPSRRGRCGR